MYVEQHILSLPLSRIHECPPTAPPDVSQMYHDNLSCLAICAWSQTEGFIPHQWSAVSGHLRASLVEEFTATAAVRQHKVVACVQIRASACMCWVNECICMCVSLCVCQFWGWGLTRLIRWDKGSGAVTRAQSECMWSARWGWRDMNVWLVKRNVLQ